MTYDEALDKVKGYLTDVIPMENYSEVEEIIKALKQEPCEDCISRQDVVSEIHKYFVEEIDKTPTKIDEDGDELYMDMPTVNSFLACNKELSKRIKSLPSVEPKTGKWVPIVDGDPLTMEDFKKYVESLESIETQIVYIRYKYSWEENWTYSNEILEVDMNADGYYVWVSDWNEGQEDIEILGCIALSDIYVPKFPKTYEIIGNGGRKISWMQ